MGSRIQTHKLKNGLIVSGRGPEQPKERQPTVASRAVPYTGGDVKNSGEFGKMFDIPVLDHSKLSRPSSSSQHSSGSVRSEPNSGPIAKSHSGSMKKSSGPMPLQPTGLIISGPLGSGQLGSGMIGSSGGRRSGQLEQTGSKKAAYGSAVTSLTEVKVGFKVSKVAVWVFLVVVVMGLLVGAFLMVAVKKALFLVAVAGVLVPVAMVMMWNWGWRKRGVLGFVRRYPDAQLREAKNGQCVKVTGIITCGSIPLESSYLKIPRCVYVSTELYEYQQYDFQTGLRALVKAGSGHKVAPFVKPATVANITKQNKDLAPSFLSWLAERNISSDDSVLRLKEGYIKEGSTVSVIGVVERLDNVLMIVPPPEPISTGCQWVRCLLPAYVEGLILTCDDNQNADVIPV